MTTNNFGPWSSALGEPARAQLSSFWKRRMTMLPTLERTSPRVSRPASWLLAAAAVTALALPMLNLVESVAAAPREADSGAKKALPPKPAEESTADTEKIFRADLPGGAAIEIVGVGEHPSQGKPWWSAAGEPVEAPYARAPVNLHEAEKLLRELAVRVIEAPDVKVRWELEPNGSAGGGTPLDARGRTIPNLSGRAQAFPGGAFTCSMRIGVADGSWTMMHETSGRARESVGKLVGTVGYGFAFTPAYEQTKDAKVTTTIIFSDNIQRQDVRVVTLDRKGNELAARRGSRFGAADFSMTTVAFADLPLERIDKFRIEARPFQWFEIRDISLHPGVKTKPVLVALDE